ncbi:transmembrane protein 212 [Protopterus annectens]|uniref:transmembrane protein 212 n=1 Tax=Protopterus annectens TaxID=7888 RepID=UPI001CFA5842|nr:transmembrane protein 212 [Protopterus annectens]
MKTRFRYIGGLLIAFGFINICSGIFAFFPVFSFKPWFTGWSVRISCPVWNGALAVIVGVLVLLSYEEWTRRSLWEASYMFAILSTVAAPVQFTVALVSILIGPYCYYSFAGIAGTNYVAYAVRFPFPYSTSSTVCQDPHLYEWYHLALQIVDLISSFVVFCTSLTFVVKLTARLNRVGHLNVQT